MFLKKLELVGFKSFYEKTTLLFEPGITVIVGPNGCGKSNIFDSIRWVLGEQSVKSLRGSEMLDVIFNGTDTKEPLSMAEVNLTFDNSQRYFSVNHDDVVITRRLFRSGESEYLLNKNIVRLKDILDILMGTGIGAESYSLVEQGKIDLVLSAKPEDRRLVFDEASGITKYKAQKRETERKLEETDQNLLRVNDIITEVKRQIGSLERQAQKARRYKEVFEGLKSKEINSSMLQKQRLLAQKGLMEAELAGLGKQEQELITSIRQQEAKISNHQIELKDIEEALMSAKTGLLDLESLLQQQRQRIELNAERMEEIEATKAYLNKQLEQAVAKLAQEEEKLFGLTLEYERLVVIRQEKEATTESQQSQLQAVACSIKASQERIAQDKKHILELAANIANTRNQITDGNAKQHIYMARQRRLELERSKIEEEKAFCEENLARITAEAEQLRNEFEQLTQSKLAEEAELEKERRSFEELSSRIIAQEKELLTLRSHREFIERLQTTYEDIRESMNAAVYLDAPPQEEVTGLVIKVKQTEEQGRKLSGEAKPIDFNTQKIAEKVELVETSLNSLSSERDTTVNSIQQLQNEILSITERLRAQEIRLAGVRTSRESTGEQFRKIKDELDVVTLELQDVHNELSGLNENMANLENELSLLEKEQLVAEEDIHCQQNSIAEKSGQKESALVTIAQLNTEIQHLKKRMDSWESELRAAKDACQQDKEHVLNLEDQLRQCDTKKMALVQEVAQFERKIEETTRLIVEKKQELEKSRQHYSLLTDGYSEVLKEVEGRRNELDTLKSRLHEKELQAQDLDFKISSIRERMLQLYKIDIESQLEVSTEIDEGLLSEELEQLRQKLDSYGTVNLVAIEEYDELKKRYDFLSQQQADLMSAKEFLREAIAKINRTTRKMFLETFEQVRGEFRTYFKLLFGGGDAQVFLADENDPLESGIEIICRPPGKKLQNVLLLSGGEKSMAAIALIFAIFKVKPSLFCVLDEIDAALDEANVDRFSGILQEFAERSQFIVITHNKRTITNASVMYGITMEESGISKIVSVKFAENKPAVQEQAPVAQPA